MIGSFTETLPARTAPQAVGIPNRHALEYRYFSPLCAASPDTGRGFMAYNVTPGVTRRLKNEGSQIMMHKRTLRHVVWLGSAIVAFGASTGCVTEPATQPAEPLQVPPPDTNVYFYPTKGQLPAQQDRDKYECHAWAVQQSGFDPSSPYAPPHLRMRVEAEGPPPGTGVAIGAATGAVVGAAVSRPWEAGQGALLGAVAGAVIGGVTESAASQQARAQASANAGARATRLEGQARDYRRAMTACLEARGYNVR